MMETITQVSAGGVVCRERAPGTPIVVVSVGPKRRWQLPKGVVEANESTERAATREVREEGGVEADVIAPLETIEYWYVATENGARVRFHKFVHFFLFLYRAGDVRDHDHEVHEARWVSFDEAAELLAFPNERGVVAKARTLIEGS
jgi:8-oxo-dGTP pyrophosphatase MutT (NUDIX family)